MKHVRPYAWKALVGQFPTTGTSVSHHTQFPVILSALIPLPPAHPGPICVDCVESVALDAPDSNYQCRRYNYAINFTILCTRTQLLTLAPIALLPDVCIVTKLMNSRISDILPPPSAGGQRR